MIIKKLRRLNAGLQELGLRNLTLTLTHELPNTALEIYKAVEATGEKAASRTIDVSYEPRLPLTLEFVTYEESLRVWTQAQPGSLPVTTVENEHVKATFTARNPPKDRNKPIGGNIDIADEFVDYALKLVETKIREKFKEEILKELVDARLKERNLV